MLSLSRQFFPLALAFLVGCQPSSFDPPAPPAEPDPTTVGTIAGRVVWSGDQPAVPPLDAAPAVNPFAPRVAADRGLAGAVVFLRDIHPSSARGWDHPPARVEMSPERIHVIQGDDPPRSVGFVKRGDEVTMQSAGGGTLMLRARGAAFFTLAFPDAGRPLARRFDKPGVVELSSGSGQFWAAADVFVCDHPYYTVTGPDGSFSLPGVVAGDHELSVWVRNWHVVGKDRNPETGLVVRLRYAEPVEKRLSVRVAPGRTTAVETSLSSADFRD